MRHSGHIRQRSPGSYELRYNIGIDPATGKRKTITTTLRGTRKQAEKELRRLLHTIDNGEHVDPSRVTVRDWLSRCCWPWLLVCAAAKSLLFAGVTSIWTAA